MMPVADLPRELTAAVTLPPAKGPWVERGGSAIIGPDSQYVIEPVFDREELILADLDLTQIDRETMTFDASGHYARPDLFRFEKKDIHGKGQS
jgi:predicted amidohydrolase